jgi:antitoxin ParD1/3/4
VMLAQICAILYASRMAQLNISVPEGLKQWADQRVAEGRYSSTSDLVRDLMRRRQEEEAQLAVLQAAIDRGRASGEDPRPVAEIFESIKRDHHAKHG